MNRILLVEDDREIRDMICRFFQMKKDNIIVDTAKDGEEGLEKIFENQYDLLLLDV
ncbi:MAG TPA: DNA-binding response regulator, partial [Ruminococcus sp.]|nr:DNA-binding response regulator [Ruminococcus sp.]